MESTLSPLNLYDVLQDCFHGSKPEDYHQAVLGRGGAWPLPGSASLPGLTLSFSNLGLNPPCIDTRIADIWLNNADVRKAIHAGSIQDIGKWEICSGKLSYTREIESTLPIYHRLMNKYAIRELIYSGDADLCVPHTGSERWTSELKLPIREVWGPWFVSDRQVAGFR